MHLLELVSQNPLLHYLDAEQVTLLQRLDVPLLEQLELLFYV